MKFKDIWGRVNPVARMIFVLLILYVILGISYLCISMGIINFTPNLSDHPLTTEYVSAGFAIVSFVFIVFISAFHLSTLIRRRKRHADKIADGKIRA
jgi:uncharacterized membrane protein